MFAKLLTIAAVVGMAQAACPNACSGHGTCGQNEVCTCFDGWGMGGNSKGGDCSERFCPYELAWVDEPTSSGLTHQYAECAAKGICDRETGQCACFGGYEGKACGRQTCPDSCSGHGTCEFMNELTYGNVFNDFYSGATAYTDALNPGNQQLGVGAVRPSSDSDAWDVSRARACSCDASWTGINCASRTCPYGNDVMDQRLDTSDTRVSQVQTIRLVAGGGDLQHNGTGADVVGTFSGKSFSLIFTSKTNEQFETTPLLLNVAGTHPHTIGALLTGYSDLADKVSSALLGLPNRVIDGCTTTVKSTGDTVATTDDEWIDIAVTFSGNSVMGNQNLLEVSTNPCGSGCTPKIDGLADVLSTNQANGVSYVKQTTSADFNSFECGRRGKCDSDAGICGCFEGYTGESCSSITALV